MGILKSVALGWGERYDPNIFGFYRVGVPGVTPTYALGLSKYSSTKRSHSPCIESEVNKVPQGHKVPQGQVLQRHTKGYFLNHIL